MNSVKYVGMDVHKGITVIVVLNAAGHVEGRPQVKTKAENFRDFFRGLSGRVEVVFEEGAHSAWLYQLLKPLIAEVTVCDPRHNKLIGDINKSDDDDAETLARLLRMREVKAVYKGDCEQQKLKELCRAYKNLVEDTTRAQNRLKAIYRGRGLDSSGTEIYRPERRADYLARLSDEAARFRAESLFDQIESLRELRKQAKSRFLEQARKHPDYPILAQCQDSARFASESCWRLSSRRIASVPSGSSGLISGWRWSPNRAPITKRSREESSNLKRSRPVA